jgi:hypothetical protein
MMLIAAVALAVVAVDVGCTRGAAGIDFVVEARGVACSLVIDFAMPASGIGPAVVTVVSGFSGTGDAVEATVCPEVPAGDEAVTGSRSASIPAGSIRCAAYALANGCLSPDTGELAGVASRTVGGEKAARESAAGVSCTAGDRGDARGVMAWPSRLGEVAGRAFVTLTVPMAGSPISCAVAAPGVGCTLAAADRGTVAGAVTFALVTGATLL